LTAAVAAPLRQEISTAFRPKISCPASSDLTGPVKALTAANQTRGTNRANARLTQHLQRHTIPAVSYVREDAPMKKFLVLYMANAAAMAEMMKNATPEQQKQGMDAWMKWMSANQSSLIDGGAPLGKTKRLDTKGTSDTKNDIGGYSIVQAESADAAAKILGKDHPHLRMPSAWIEVIEIMQIPGM
jgi:hypothetical protein